MAGRYAAFDSGATLPIPKRAAGHTNGDEPRKAHFGREPQDAVSKDLRDEKPASRDRLTPTLAKTAQANRDSTIEGACASARQTWPMCLKASVLALVSYGRSSLCTCCLIGRSRP